MRSKDGLIDKIDHYDNATKLFHCENHNYIDPFNEIAIPVSQIVKYSKNIIDLIEVGDYVNGSYVVDILEDMQTGELHLEMTYNYTNEEKGDCTIYNKDIKTIATKEQMQSIEYRVE